MTTKLPGGSFEALADIEIAAEAGRRCPENGHGRITSKIVACLARAGYIKISISGANYRQIAILLGPNEGKSTAPDPTGAKVWKVVDKNGTFINGQLFIAKRGYRTPPLHKVGGMAR